MSEFFGIEKQWINTEHVSRLDDWGNRLDIFVVGQETAVVMAPGDGQAAETILYLGRHRLTVDASSLPAGLYFVRLRVDGWVETRSLLVAR